ncbi:hypothetical protein WDJ51_11575 [Rathayibacter sp. YIM 133350]|uniref:hypothetical protein n=1 Tax=Rathayibacter sp. YIM 133350 TaxID=3131992 RepID=UPI00307F15CE
MSIPAEERVVQVSVNRIEIEADVPFAELRSAFEAEVLPVDEELFRRLVEQGAEWREFVRASAGSELHGFVSFWQHHPSAIMHIGGADVQSASYLIGDYATAARMFRHDAGIMLHLPLRIEMHSSRPGGTVLSVDQPSSVFAVFDNNKITQAAVELDRRLGDLIEQLGLPRPTALRR